MIVIDYIMAVTLDDDKSDSGFTLWPAQSRGVGVEKLPDVEFDNNVDLITDTIEWEKLLLNRLETAALNDTKTKFMAIKQKAKSCAWFRVQ